MIAAGPYRSGGHKEAHVQGWLVSVLLHGTVVLAAMLIVKQIQLPPQDEPFKWNVTMVSPTQPVTPATSPPNQAPTPPVPSTTPVPPPPCSRLRQHRRPRRPSRLRNRQLHRLLNGPSPRSYLSLLTHHNQRLPHNQRLTQHNQPSQSDMKLWRRWSPRPHPLRIQPKHRRQSLRNPMPRRHHRALRPQSSNRQHNLTKLRHQRRWQPSLRHH